MPSSVTVIGDSAFAYCLKLSALAVPYGIIEWTNATGDSTVVYFEGASSVTAVGSGSTIDLAIEDRGRPIAGVTIGTSHGGSDVATLTGAPWSFEKQASEKYYAAVTSGHMVTVNVNVSSENHIEYDLDDSGNWKKVPSDGRISVPFGSSVKLRGAPAPGWAFAWTTAENVTDGIMSLSPTEDTIVHGSFSEVLYSITGNVKHGTNNLSNVLIGYNLNGVKTVRTDKDGDYSISVDEGDVVAITDVSKGKFEVTELPPEIRIGNERTKIDFEL
jgi:hypothetical protein